MPRFIYTAKSQPHKTIQGNIDAETEQEAVNKLTRMGYYPVSVRPEGAFISRQGNLYLRKIPAKEIVLFTRQLANLVESGVNILSGLDIISGQIPNNYLKAVVNDIVAKIKDGKSFSETLSAYPLLFSNLYKSMIFSGETGGNLEQALKHLADFLEKEEEFKNSIRASLVYPAFIFGVGAITVAVLLGFVIPRLVTMFTDMGQLLPLPTRILIAVSGAFQRNIWLILAVVFAIIFLLRRFSNRPQGRLIFDKLKLRLPVWANIILKTDIGRMTRTLSLLISSGIPIVNALEISTALIENQALALEVKKFKEQIANGASLSRCIKDSRFFPALVANIVAVGEESGGLEKALLRIADTYEHDVDRSLVALSRLLEPVIILMMGLIVGFIVLSMLLPIFQINLIVR